MTDPVVVQDALPGSRSFDDLAKAPLRVTHADPLMQDALPGR